MAGAAARLQGAVVVLLLLVSLAAACSHGHGAGSGGRRLQGAAQRKPSRRRCPVGLTWTGDDVRQKQLNFFARVVQRFGASSPQALAFVPAANLTAAAALAATRGPLQPATAPLSVDGDDGSPAGAQDLEPDALSALTAQVAALKRAADDAAAGLAPAAAPAGRRRLQAANPITIHTYVHAITNAAKADYLPDATISNQIQVMNEAYGQWGIRFTLVNVTRAANDAWAKISDSSSEPSNARAMKKALRRGRAADLNIYLVPDLGSLLGYAYLPEDYDSQPQMDGVVILSRSLPNVQQGFIYNEGDTATHEVGHWLGLLHTFQEGCDSDPSNGGDLISDTPAEKSANMNSCRVQRNTCRGRRYPGKDPVRNFMDYSPDACMDSFTSGQAARMLEQFITYRAGR